MSDTRDRIISTTFRLFLEQGIDNVSLKQITKEAGVSGGGLYHHFETKEELIAEVERIYILETYQTAMNNINVDEGSLLDKITEVIKNIANYDLASEEIPKTNDDFYKKSYYLYLDCLRKDDKNSKILEKFNMDALNVLKKVINDEKAKGKVNPDLDTDNLAMYLLALINGAVYTSATVPDVNLKTAFDYNISAFLEHIK